MSYTGSALGFDVMRVDAALQMDPAGYHVDLAFRTVGLLALFVRSEQRIWCGGRGATASPSRCASGPAARCAGRRARP